MILYKGKEHEAKKDLRQREREDFEERESEQKQSGDSHSRKIAVASDESR